MIDVTKKKFEGDWFWIPNHKVDIFEEAVKNIEGFDYMKNSESFDKFEDAFGRYRTEGCETLMPQYFKKINICFEKDDGGFLAYVDNFGGVNTQGDTKYDAKVNLLDAFNLYIDTLKSDFLKAYNRLDV